MLILIGFLSGVISGMGIGGGTILIPALVLLNNLPQHQAQGINLIYFLPTAVVALILHKKSGNIETKIIKPIILFGLLGAVAGSLLAWSIDADMLRKIFGIFLIIMGVAELFKKEKRNESN